MRQIGEHNSALLICIAIGSVWFAKCVGQDAFAEPAKRDNGTFQRESGDGTDPNRLNKNGQTLLHIAVAEQNSEAARILLDHGAKYDIPNREGKTALDVALTGGLRAVLLADMFKPKSKGSDDPSAKRPVDPSVQVCRVVMHAVRKTTRTHVDWKGNVSVALDYQGMGANGLQMTARIKFDVNNKAYSLNLSQFETDYVGLKVSEGQVVLRSGGVYHVVGEEKGGEIEVTLLALEQPPVSDSAMVLPVDNWLPSTWAAMQEHVFTKAQSK